MLCREFHCLCKLSISLAKLFLLHGKAQRRKWEGRISAWEEVLQLVNTRFLFKDQAHNQGRQHNQGKPIIFCTFALSWLRDRQYEKNSIFNLSEAGSFGLPQGRIWYSGLDIPVCWWIQSNIFIRPMPDHYHALVMFCFLFFNASSAMSLVQLVIHFAWIAFCLKIFSFNSS